MLEDDVMAGLCQLVVAVIVGIVAGQPQCVALYHLDMAESLEGIGLLKEVGTVAIKVGTHMTEVYIAFQNLGVTILELVVVQIVSMHQIDALVLHLLFPWSTLPCRLHGKHHTQHYQAQNDKKVSLHFLNICIISPNLRIQSRSYDSGH